MLFAVPAEAQLRGPTAEQALDRARQVYGPPAPEPNIENCSREQEAAAVSGEIVVCRRLNAAEAVSGFDLQDWERRYAAATMDKDNPKTPDFIRDCAEQGWPVGCFKLGTAPPPAYMIDFDSLPDAPPGSDADLIARGEKKR